MVNFSKAKELFRDIIDTSLYIPLPSSEKTKEDLLSAILQKEKLILLTGNAGSGKTLLLRRIYEELKENREVFFVSNPYLEIDTIITLLKNLDINTHQILLFDEAQLLTPEMWENLRIYADRGNVTIVFSTHDTNIKKLLEKKHFKTRINYIIRAKNISLNEMENFIYSKLLKNNLNEIADMFNKKHFKRIYKYTKGSLRATNQIMFKIFDVLEFFYNKNPENITSPIDKKYIEIAIMDLKANNA